MLSKISPTTHCAPHPKHQWAAKEQHERKSLILDRNINMVLRTDTGNDIDNGCWLKCLCFLCFKASWTVWCHFNTNADKWPQPCWNRYLHLWVFFFFFSPKTPSQIQADIDAFEGGQCRLGKNLSERKASWEFAAYAYKINSIFQQSGGEKEKKNFKQTVVEVNGHNQDVPNKQGLWQIKRN